MNVEKVVAELKRMTVSELRVRYAEVFQETTKTGNKQWLIKRIAWRLQVNAHGDISERARQRAEELANDADLRMNPPKPKPPKNAGQKSVQVLAIQHPSDERLPPPGSDLTRVYKGETKVVRVLENGFLFEGEVFKSLSAVAKNITGQHCNGYSFFQLKKATPK